MVSLGLLLLRLVVGSIYAVHGYAKVFGGQGKGETVSPEAEKLLGSGFKQFMDYGGVQNVSGFMQSLGVPYPKPAAIALMTAEFVGGLALILGWRTRLAALALTVVQAIAIQKVHAPHGLIHSSPEGSGYEFNATLAAATATLAITGPGKLSLD
jgi:putative oxidoreductase